MAEPKFTPPTNYPPGSPPSPYAPPNGYPQGPPLQGTPPQGPPLKVPSSPGSGSVATHGAPSSQRLPPQVLHHLQQPNLGGGHQPVPPENQLPPVYIPPEEQRKRYQVEQIVTGIIVALSSIIILVLGYVSIINIGNANSLGPLEQKPEGPLAAGVILLLLNIGVGIWLCTDITAANGIVGLVPVGFNVLGCIFFIIYFAAWTAFVRGASVWNVNRVAVLFSSAAFTGMAFGNAIGYVFFGNNPSRAK